MNKRRIVARILAVLMAFTMLPQTAIVAMAEEGDQGTEQKTVTITYAVEGNGSVDPASETVDLENLEIKGSTATAAEGYEFVNWTNGAGEEVATNATYAPAATDVTEDVTYTAHFQEKAKDPDPEPENPQNPLPETPKENPQNPNPEYKDLTITYAVNDAEYGNVSVVDGEGTSETYNTKDAVTTIKGAKATAKEGYKFLGWKKSADDTEYLATTEQLTLSEKPTADVTYTAYFEKEQTPKPTPSKAPEAPSNDGTVTSPADVEAGKAYVVSNQTSYATLTDAIRNASSTDAIYLGKGTFSSYDGSDIATDKNLTIIGSGTDKTTWNIGTKQEDQHNLNNGDYSLKGASSITFKNMTLQAGVKPDGSIDDHRDYLGFTHIQNGDAKTVVENCVINGKTYYWGYKSAEFKNTTFNCPTKSWKTFMGYPIELSLGDYALWTYSSPSMTFDTCTFNAHGKVINVYRDYAGAEYTINFKDCTVNNDADQKQVLNINDSYPANQKYNIYISGNNKLNGTEIGVDNITCSRLYGFGGKSGNNASNTTVYIENNKVFESGKLIDHEHGTIDGGSYSNGKASNTTYDYSEGHKDDAYTTTEGEWETDPDTGLMTREITKKCNYCSWSSEEQESKKETETKDLPGDILIDGNTEHNAVPKYNAGSTFELTGALQVSSVLDQMKTLENLFNSPAGNTITLSDVQFGFTATLTLPTTGITLPSDVKVNAEGLANTYQIASTSVSDDRKTVTVKFALTDDAASNITTYAELKKYVEAAGKDGWLKVTIPGCTVDSNVAAGTRLTVKGTVSGSFSAKATSQYGTTYTFPYEWNGTQWADGKDATAAADNNAIQLTIEVTVPSTPEEPETPSTPDNNDDGGDEPAPQSNDSTPAPAVAPAVEPVVEVTESGNEGDTTVEEVIEIAEGGNASEETVTEITEGGAIAATGDESPIVLYGMITLMAGAALVLWASKRRAR